MSDSAIKTHFSPKCFINYEEKRTGQRQLSVWASRGEAAYPHLSDTVICFHCLWGVSLGVDFSLLFYGGLFYLWRHFNRKKYMEGVHDHWWLSKGQRCNSIFSSDQRKNAGCSGNSDKNISLILKNEALEVWFSVLGSAPGQLWAQSRGFRAPGSALRWLHC